MVFSMKTSGPILWLIIISHYTLILVLGQCHLCSISIQDLFSPMFYNIAHLLNECDELNIELNIFSSQVSFTLALVRTFLRCFSSIIVILFSFSKNEICVVSEDQCVWAISYAGYCTTLLWETPGQDKGIHGEGISQDPTTCQVYHWRFVVDLMNNIVVELKKKTSFVWMKGFCYIIRFLLLTYE